MGLETVCSSDLRQDQERLLEEKFSGFLVVTLHDILRV